MSTISKNLPRILLTGFTGIIGKRFAYRLAREGYQVFCLIRGGSEKDVAERFDRNFNSLRDLLPDFDESMKERLVPVQGDVREKGLGIPSSFLPRLRGPEMHSVWHLAARLDLTETRSGDVYQTNFVGTSHVLDWMRQQSIRELHFVSTYGASGEIRQGVVREIPGIKPPSFRNTYERTKWEAERLVWQAQIRGEISASIYRPSIVVGDSILGRYEQFNVFNHVFDVISRVRVKLCEKQGLDPKTDTLKHEMRVLGDRHATLNIVPIDYVVDTMLKVFSAPHSLGSVYHIVNPNPPSLGLVEKIFLDNEPWDGAHFELYDPQAGYLSSYEKFIAKQISFLGPYIMGEAIYDDTNVHAILSHHGGVPELKNEVFLDAISKRGKKYGWQESADQGELAPGNSNGESPKSFDWPDSNEMAFDFSPVHPVESNVTPSSYPITDRFLSKVYQVRERLASRIGDLVTGDESGGRDIVIVPFGLGMTRRGEAEVEFYQKNPELTSQVFSRMNQVVGFDLRAFAKKEISGHEDFSEIHDNGCWSVADDLVHLIKIFRDLQRHGVSDFHSRLQILPFSAGTYLSGWLSGILSFEDMALLTHQGLHLMSECENLISKREIFNWFFNPKAKLSEWEIDLLKEIRSKVDPELKLSPKEMEAVVHGRLELVFGLNSNVLDQLIREVREQRIQVAPAIKLSPNTTIFAGNELEMTRFRKLFGGKRKIELRRVAVDVRGTPHFLRLKDAAKFTADLLKIYNDHGRLRDPVVPFISYNGEVVSTKEQFIKAVSGIPDQTCYFDKMIDRVLENGGRHFVMVQSGLASTAGDLFEGVIRKNANSRNCKSVVVYQPHLVPGEPHPICKLLSQDEQSRIPDAQKQPLADTLKWYERELSKQDGLIKEIALKG